MSNQKESSDARGEDPDLPTDGERADVPGLGTRYIVGSDRTDGRFSLLEHTIPARGLAAPVHTHQSEDEYSYVLSGRIGAMVGEEFVEAAPGEVVVKPRGVPHAFWNPGDEEARLLELISPGASTGTSPRSRPCFRSTGRRTSRL